MNPLPTLMTEKGEPHSTLLLSLYVDGDGKATKAQLKWFSSIISILANNWKAELEAVD